MKKKLIEDKGDTVGAQKLCEHSDELVLLHGRELLEWLQNMNWPVAGYVSRRLRLSVNELEPEVLEILGGNDLEWKINTVDYLIGLSDCRPTDLILKKLFDAIGNEPMNEDESNYVEICKSVLDHWGISS